MHPQFRKEFIHKKYTQMSTKQPTKYGTIVSSKCEPKPLPHSLTANNATRQRYRQLIDGGVADVDGVELYEHQ